MMATSLLALVFVRKAQSPKKGKVLASTLVNEASEKSGSLAISAIVSIGTYRCWSAWILLHCQVLVNNTSVQLVAFLQALSPGPTQKIGKGALSHL